MTGVCRRGWCSYQPQVREIIKKVVGPTTDIKNEWFLTRWIQARMSRWCRCLNVDTVLVLSSLFSLINIWDKWNYFKWMFQVNIKCYANTVFYLHFCPLQGRLFMRRLRDFCFKAYSSNSDAPWKLVHTQRWKGGKTGVKSKPWPPVNWILSGWLFLLRWAKLVLKSS